METLSISTLTICPSSKSNSLILTLTQYQTGLDGKFPFTSLEMNLISNTEFNYVKKIIGNSCFAQKPLLYHQTNKTLTQFLTDGTNWLLTEFTWSIFMPMENCSNSEFSCLEISWMPKLATCLMILKTLSSVPAM